MRRAKRRSNGLGAQSTTCSMPNAARIAARKSRMATKRVIGTCSTPGRRATRSRSTPPTSGTGPTRVPKSSSTSTTTPLTQNR